MHESIKGEFSKELNAAVENVFGGDQADAPVMVNGGGRDKTKKLVEQALQVRAIFVTHLVLITTSLTPDRLVRNP